ncbi:hypothetical protein EB118_22835 [bacterium]|nr:hypothetical protein [bacterium]
MKFLEYIAEATSGKNLHMEHIEDNILNGGVYGAREAINFLRKVRDMLAGNSESKVNITVKWDGCIHEDTIVLTNLGDMTIKEIVERCQWDDSLMVMGKELDLPSKPNRMVPILGGMFQNGNKKWVEIQLEDGTKYKMTEDHEVHTANRGWVKACELTKDDDITEL